LFAKKRGKKKRKKGGGVSSSIASAGGKKGEKKGGCHVGDIRREKKTGLAGPYFPSRYKRGKKRENRGAHASLCGIKGGKKKGGRGKGRARYIVPYVLKVKGEKLHHKKQRTSLISSALTSKRGKEKKKGRDIPGSQIFMFR